MALVGLDGLFKLFPWAYATFKVAGALYLLYVAWTTWRGANDPVETSDRPQSPGRFWAGFWSTLPIQNRFCSRPPSWS